ncbi:MAG: winged helix-turn-helix transcriptional regulator [Candidatus Methanomethylicia archaeon]
MKLRSLDEEDYKILTVLGKNPLSKVVEISKLTGLNVKTVSKRLKNLIESKVLYYVAAQICAPSLDMDSIIVFSNVKFKDIPIIEKVCDLHLYTRYRIRVLGSVNGLLMAFNMPKGSQPLLINLLDELEKLGYIRGYNYYTTIAKWIYNENDFSRYNVREDSWNFDWNVWERRIESVEKAELNPYPPSILHQMNEKDMTILRELTINARERLKDISKKTGIPEYHLSRRISFYIDNGVIEGFRVVVYTHASRIFDQFIFKCKCPVTTTAKIATTIKELPFQSTFVPLKEGFILQIFLPPTSISEFGKIIQGKVEEMEFMWADYKTSMRYYFYGEPFKTGRWQIDRKTLINDILTKIKI